MDHCEMLERCVFFFCLSRAPPLLGYIDEKSFPVRFKYISIGLAGLKLDLRREKETSFSAHILHLRQPVFSVSCICKMSRASSAFPRPAEQEPRNNLVRYKRTIHNCAIIKWRVRASLAKHLLLCYYPPWDLVGCLCTIILVKLFV